MNELDLPRKAPKFSRFLVACSVGKEWKDDTLVAFDERFEIIQKEFGSQYAVWWAWQQAIRSIPFRSLWFIAPLSTAAGAIVLRMVT